VVDLKVEDMLARRDELYDDFMRRELGY